MRIVRYVIITCIFLFPVVFIIINKKEKKEIPSVNTSVLESNTNNVSLLENEVNKNPSFDNLINLSQAYITNKLYGKSKDVIQRALLLNPESSIAYNNLGVTYIYQEQYQNAIDACNKAIMLDATFQLAKNNLKWAMDEKNKLTEIIKSQEQIHANKRNESYYIDLGLNYFKLGDYTNSINLWNKVFEINPKSTKALNNIGTAFVFKFQYGDAIALFNQALKLEPENQLARNNLAWAMDEKHKAEKKKP